MWHWGFYVLSPEQLASEFDKQALLSRCRVLAGLPGSGMLSAVFMPEGGTVIVIVSEQGNKLNPAFVHQCSINLIKQHKTAAYIERDIRLGMNASYRIDVERLGRFVAPVLADVCNPESGEQP